jgi:hypothetical protein
MIVIWLYIYWVNTKPENTTDLCYKSQDFQVKVKACGDILRKSDGKYLMLVKAIEDNSRLASWAREEIKKARDEFYKTTLSGLNVDF